MAIYFMQAGLAAPIKIGCSRNVEKRLYAVQQVHFEEVRLLAVAEGCQRVEAVVHEMLASSRIRGEWYAMTLEMADMIGRINRGDKLFDMLPPDQPDRYCQSTSCKTCPYAAWVAESGGKVRRYEYDLASLRVSACCAASAP